MQIVVGVNAARAVALADLLEHMRVTGALADYHARRVQRAGGQVKKALYFSLPLGTRWGCSI